MILVVTQFTTMLQRNLIYACLTRGQNTLPTWSASARPSVSLCVALKGSGDGRSSNKEVLLMDAADFAIWPSRSDHGSK